MPSAEDQVHRAIVHMRVAAPERNFVVEAEHPAQLLIEVGPAPLGRQVVAVLREGRGAANFGQIVDGFAVGERAQKVEAVAGMLLGFDLQRVVVRIGDVGDGGESAELREWPAWLDISRARQLDLVWIDNSLQVGAL